MPPVKYIHVDLEPNRILKQVADGGQEVLAAFFRALAKIHSFSNMAELNQDQGLNWEKLVNKIDPGTKLPLYTFRITLKWRALCLLHPGPVIEIVAVTTAHDGTH
jgi:hypothetical protein